MTNFRKNMFGDCSIIRYRVAWSHVGMERFRHSSVVNTDCTLCCGPHRWPASFVKGDHRDGGYCSSGNGISFRDKQNLVTRALGL